MVKAFDSCEASCCFLFFLSIGRILPSAYSKWQMIRSEGEIDKEDLHTMLMLMIKGLTTAKDLHEGGKTRLLNESSNYFVFLESFP